MVVCTAGVCVGAKNAWQQLRRRYAGCFKWTETKTPWLSTTREDKEKMLKLPIRALGGDTVAVLECTESDSVRRIKESIASLRCTRPSLLNLFHEGRVLDDNEKLFFSGDTGVTAQLTCVCGSAARLESLPHFCGLYRGEQTMTGGHCVVEMGLDSADFTAQAPVNGRGEGEGLVAVTGKVYFRLKHSTLFPSKVGALAQQQARSVVGSSGCFKLHCEDVGYISQAFLAAGSYWLRLAPDGQTISCTRPSGTEFSLRRVPDECASAWDSTFLHSSDSVSTDPSTTDTTMTSSVDMDRRWSAAVRHFYEGAVENLFPLCRATSRRSVSYYYRTNNFRISLLL
eukprot:TRINITY_DN17928_c0_g2_i1.p1 TRINITY_DN17928_c0_g2~~TRINITY_DN17928_c0_g2_i1.p1  ORF type:complete len:350 (-),score=49.08 TRINITY_DN17928_c0_g2_i1:561-1583(-)